MNFASSGAVAGGVWGRAGIAVDSATDDDDGGGELGAAEGLSEVQAARAQTAMVRTRPNSRPRGGNCTSPGVPLMEVSRFRIRRSSGGPGRVDWPRRTIPADLGPACQRLAGARLLPRGLRSLGP